MQIDARNLACPRPVVLALEALPKLAAGESLEVLVNDEVAPANLTRLAAEKDCEVATADHGDHVSVMLTPRSSTAATDGAVSAGFSAGNVVKEISGLVGGKGGGRPNMAQAGGKDAAGIDAALDAAKKLLGA